MKENESKDSMMKIINEALDKNGTVVVVARAENASVVAVQGSESSIVRELLRATAENRQLIHIFKTVAKIVEKGEPLLDLLHSLQEFHDEGCENPDCPVHGKKQPENFNQKKADC